MVDGDHIIKTIEQFLKNHSEMVGFALINATGEWLLSQSEGQLRRIDSGMVVNERHASHIHRALKERKPGYVSYDALNYKLDYLAPLQGRSPFYNQYNYFLVAGFWFSDADLLRLQDSFTLRNAELRWYLAVLIVLLGGGINVIVHKWRSDRKRMAVGDLVSEQSRDGVLIVDTNGEITYCNPALVHHTEFTDREILAGKLVVYTLGGARVGREGQVLEKKGPRGAAGGWNGLVWVQGARHYALTHLQTSSIVNIRRVILHHVILFSSPGSIGLHVQQDLVSAEGFVHHEY